MKHKKQMTEAEKAEAKRLARNAYSRKWKATHKDKVRKWNQVRDNAQKKKTAKCGRKTVAKKQAVAHQRELQPAALLGK